MNVKDRFPTEDSLKNFIAENIEANVQQVRDSVGHLEAEYIKKTHNYMVGFGLIIAGFFIAVLPVYSGGEGGFFISILFFVLGGYIIYIGWNKIKMARKVILEFNLALNICVYKLVFELLGVNAQYSNVETKQADQIRKRDLFSIMDKAINFIPRTKLSEETLRFLDKSELITESRNKIWVDDVYSVESNDHKLRVSELVVKNVTGRGKSKQIKEIFTGLFAVLDLPRELQDKTFVSTEGDRDGFGNQSFINRLTGEGVQLVDLEWNDFEEKLHVVSTSQTEARYILTPDFMTDLYSWWKNKKQNIRISFIEKHMYMLFPDTKIRLGLTIGKIEANDISAYMESIAVPLLHILHVVEDVQGRFRS